MHRQYGPIVRVAPDEVVFAQADAWADILQPKSGHPPFPKHPLWWAPMLDTPPGILTALDGDLHANIRRRFSPAFTPRALKSQEPILHQYIDLLVDRLREAVASDADSEVDVIRWFNYLTFDIFGDLAFAESFECLQRSQYHGWIALIMDNVKFNGIFLSSRFYPVIDSILVQLIPPSLKKAQKDHFQLIADKVRRRLDSDAQRSDFLSYITKHGIGADGQDGKRLPLGIVNATFAEFAVAASETTAMALSASLNLLMHNTDKLDILVNEIGGQFRADDNITLDAVRDLTYLNAVIHEVLRLCPPVPWMPSRQVPKGGGAVCGKHLPEGVSLGNASAVSVEPSLIGTTTYQTAVSITITAMHRESFHAPDAFHPERWLPEATANPDSPFYHDQRQAVQPFAIGPRSCIGQHVAWAEMRLALTKVLWTFDVSAPVDQTKWVVWESLKTFLLIEKKPIKVVMKVRPT